MGSPQANSIPLLGDETVSVKLTTAVYQSDSSEPTSYEKVWTGLRTGANLVLCYNGSGKLDYLYLRSSSDAVNEDNVLVAKNNAQRRHQSLCLPGDRLRRLPDL